VGPITIKNGIIGTFGGRADLSGTLATRSSVSHHHQHHHGVHNGFKSNVSSLSGLSTISGLNNASSKQPQQQPQGLSSLMGPYCQKQQPTTTTTQHANYNTGFYHHYQQPPAELLMGAGAASSAANANANSYHHQSPITSPYQITMSNNQMTKLFLANPASSGTYSVDNNYMPIGASNASSSSSAALNGGFQAPHSDSGSVYQTIY
jgi:hypothetical protein